MSGDHIAKSYTSRLDKQESNQFISIPMSLQRQFFQIFLDSLKFSSNILQRGWGHLWSARWPEFLGNFTIWCTICPPHCPPTKLNNHFANLSLSIAMGSPAMRRPTPLVEHFALADEPPWHNPRSNPSTLDRKGTLPTNLKNNFHLQDRPAMTPC